MNEFSSTESSQGLLKDDYGSEDSELQKYLKKKRDKLTDTKLGPKEEDNAERD